MSDEMSQDDIDKLMAEAAQDAPASEETEASSESAASLDAEQDALLSEIMGDQNLQASEESAGESEPVASLDAEQDALLSEIMGDQNLQASEETPTPTGPSDAEKDALMNEVMADQGLNVQGAPALPNFDAEDADIDAMLDAIQVASDGDESEHEGPEPVNTDFLLNMTLPVTFEVGRAKMLIGDLLSLGQGSVIELHRLVGEDLDLFANGKLIAKGEVVVVNEKFGVRILDIIQPEDRIKHMGDLEA